MSDRLSKVQGLKTMGTMRVCGVLTDDSQAAQLETFLHICSQSSTSSTLFDKNQRLIRHILHYGTAYERVNYHKAGKLNF